MTRSRASSLAGAAIALAIGFACTQSVSCSAQTSNSAPSPAEVPRAHGNKATTHAAEEECRRAVDAYAKDHDAAKLQATLAALHEREPKWGLPCFHLGLLAEKRRAWEEAEKWFQSYLAIDNASPLSRKVWQELSYVRWVMLYEATPAGKKKREAIEFMDAARAAASKQDWQAAFDKAYASLQARPDNLDAQMLCVAAQMKLKHYALAEAMLRMVLPNVPEERKASVEQALAECQRQNAMAAQESEAARLFAANRRGEAGDAYGKIWEKDNERYEALTKAITCHVLTHEYGKARSLLEKLKSITPQPANLPTGLRNPDALLAKLEQLRALDGKSRVASAKPAGKSGSGSGVKSTSGGTGKKSMADDFLSRIKK